MTDVIAVEMRVLEPRRTTCRPTSLRSRSLSFFERWGWVAKGLAIREANQKRTGLQGTG